MIQTKRHLGKTLYAQRLKKTCKSHEGSVFQTGGVLTVDIGRKMVRERDDDELVKACKVIEAVEKRAFSQLKKWYLEAAKEGRKWLKEGRIPPQKNTQIGALGQEMEVRL